MFKINQAFKMNIVSQLLIFFTLAISINFLQLNVLVGLLIFQLLLLIATKNVGFKHAIMRFKWFFLVMLLIFVFSTPGEYVAQWPFSANANFIGPTYEGLAAGATQVLRILLMLAALSLILASNTRQQLISGLYFILSPLQYLGLKVERFAARLWLTLHYVELQKGAQNKQDFVERLKNMTLLAPNDANEQVSITLIAPSFSWLDYVLIVLLLAAVCAVWVSA